MTKVLLKKSTRSDKKWMVIIDPTTNNRAKVHFGAEGYEDYTQHGDKERKRLYLARHRKNEDWSALGIKTAGFWSRWLLWNLPSFEASKDDIQKRFNIEFV